MTEYYQFLANPQSSVDSAWMEAESIGLTHMHLIEELDPIRYIIGGEASNILPKSFDHLILLHENQEVNWNEQSSLFSPYYKDGIISIPLSDFSHKNDKIYLRPGAGFGDLSHPTTLLCMKLLENNVVKKAVLDIGCGSGILSFASKALEASYVCGIDIDPNALEHSRFNQALNPGHEVEFCSSPSFAIESYSCWTGLMNMTFLEQKDAWQALSKWHEKVSTLITSGILAEQKMKYLSWAQDNSWTLISSEQESGWCAFVFRI
jgi:ribosomal protein L11 methyltransferase